MCGPKKFPSSTIKSPANSSHHIISSATVKNEKSEKQQASEESNKKHSITESNDNNNNSSDNSNDIDIDQVRKEHRRMMNRIHSRNKRARRKIEFEVLQEQTKEYTEKNAKLVEENTILESILKSAKAQVELIEQQDKKKPASKFTFYSSTVGDRGITDPTGVVASTAVHQDLSGFLSMNNTVEASSSDSIHPDTSMNILDQLLLTINQVQLEEQQHNNDQVVSVAGRVYPSTLLLDDHLQTTSSLQVLPNPPLLSTTAEMQYLILKQNQLRQQELLTLKHQHQQQQLLDMLLLNHLQQQTNYEVLPTMNGTGTHNITITDPVLLQYYLLQQVRGDNVMDKDK